MFRSAIPWLALALLTTACGKAGNQTPDKGVVDQSSSSKASVGIAPTATQALAPAVERQAPSFTIDAVPLSNAPLGKFPYFGLPPRYAPQNPAQTHETGQFPFWTGNSYRQVEGKIYLVTIVGAKEADYSAYELRRNMEALFAQAGGVKIAEGKIPSETIRALPEQQRSDVSNGFGDPYNDPVETWVIHRPDKEIWVHFSQNSSAAGLTVVETKPFIVTAALLPADELKAELDKTGKATVRVNFATDQAVILVTSQAQIDAVVTLLKQNPQLRLAINGYTDETGSAAHNITLSDARAKAVMAALVAAGTDQGRLQAKGYGMSNPVAANNDEAGKAQNRRVELIKL